MDAYALLVRYEICLIFARGQRESEDKWNKDAICCGVPFAASKSILLHYDIAIEEKANVLHD